MNYILIGVLIAVFAKALNYIYLFQIKEYRFDRFFSTLKEREIVQTFWNTDFLLPAKKIRNFVIASIILTILVVFYLFFNNISVLTTLIILSFLPLISLALVYLLVFLTSLPVAVYRNRIIEIAKEKVGQSQAVFIGITGSYGKTSTKEFLYQILRKKYRVAETEANMNSDIGIALSIIKNLKNDTQFFIAEIGGYRLGEIKKVVDIIKPQIAVLTAIGNQHLDLFGSKENLIAGKKELLLSLTKQGKIYLNKDTVPYKQIFHNLKSPICLYSITEKADIYAQNMKESAAVITTNVFYKNQVFNVSLSLIGKHNISNLLPCMAIAYDLGLNNKQITEAVTDLKPVEKRLALKKGVNLSTIIDDSYNSGVNGFIEAIKVSQNFSKKKRIIISKGIIELGKEKQISYSEILGEIKKTNLKLYTTDPLFKKLDRNNRVVLFKTEKEIAKKLIPLLDKKALLIIEGKFTNKFIDLIIKL